LLDVRRADTSLGHPRVAIVVPKFGFTAVRRNKLKRRLRELTRHFVIPHAGSVDLLLRARRDAYDATFDRLRADVHHIIEQIGAGARASRKSHTPE
jgi:ribonuclease P protein component